MHYKWFGKEAMYQTAKQKHFLVSCMKYSHVRVCKVDEIPCTPPVAFHLVWFLPTGLHTKAWLSSTSKHDITGGFTPTHTMLFWEFLYLNTLVSEPVTWQSLWYNMSSEHIFQRDVKWMWVFIFWHRWG